MRASEPEIEKAFEKDRKRTFEEPEAFHIRLHAGMKMKEWKRESYRDRATRRALRRWKKKK